MQTQPKNQRGKSLVIPSAIVAVIIFGGLGVWLYNNPVNAAAVTITSTSTTANNGLLTLNFNLNNRNISLVQLIDQVKGWYLGSSFFGSFNGCLHIVAQNDYLQLPANGYGYTTLKVIQGVADICPTPVGLSFDFSGTATSGPVLVSRLTLTYNAQIPTQVSGTSTTTTMVHTNVTKGALNGWFTALFPSGLVNATVSAINSSPNPQVQVNNLAAYLQGNPILNSIPGQAGQNAHAAAAYILGIATGGTSLASTAYNQLYSLFVSQTTTTTSTTTSTTTTSKSSTKSV